MKKFPRVSLNILVIKDNKVILGRLTPKWNFQGKRVYGVPGRGINFREKIGAAVKRNIKEEFGCGVRSYKITCVNANYALGNHFIGIGVVAEIDGEIKNLKPNDWEKWSWFSLKKIPHNLFPDAKNVIDCYLKNKVNVAE